MNLLNLDSAPGNTWTQDIAGSGTFTRRPSAFREWIGRDGAFPAATDRYHLYVSLACPWAHRTLILRTLKGLEEAISADIVHWHLDGQGWSFATDAPGTTGDTVHGRARLRHLYNNAASNYTGRVTVPVLYDKEGRAIVNNESSEIIRMLNSEFDAWAERPEVDLYPAALRDEIDAINEWVFPLVNDGVYRAGFARTQEAYDTAVSDVFAGLDRVEEILSRQRWLAGERFTEADVRAFTTLVRFEPIYHYHFKCNLRRLRDYPATWAFTREIYQHPLIRPTVDFFHIRQHYFRSHANVNPRRIVPIGPDFNIDEPHRRKKLGGEEIPG